MSVLRWLTATAIAAAVFVTVPRAESTPASAAAPSAVPTANSSTVEGSDPFLWLEDVHGARALTWVKSENAKTLSVLQRDPRFGTLYEQALKIDEA
ncbi:MAG: hypothetical protein JO060_06390, partial [Candidatus Eremiobacteraeota bacterium]|nr:hypothetical protein [Candidatus Eremiobacteraeota bacterium]